MATGRDRCCSYRTIDLDSDGVCDRRIAVTPSVACEAVTADSIVYQRGAVCVKLEGFLAGLYRQMIGMYGKAEATDRFWWLWHKKESPICNHHEANRATYNDK